MSSVITLQEEAVTFLGLTPKEIKSYSLTRAIRRLRSRDCTGFEFEVSKTIERKLNRSATGIYVPADVQHARRDLSVNNGSQPGDGGALVGTNLVASSFIEALRSSSIVMQLGARFLRGLVGTVEVTRQSGIGEGYWVVDGVAPGSSDPNYALVPMSPKTVGASVNVSRHLALQSTPDVDTLLWSDLAQVLGTSISRAVIAGSGADGEPTGLLNTDGVVDGTTGAANGVDFNHDDSIDMETRIRNADVIDALSWLLNPTVAGTLKKRLKIAGSTNPCYLVQDGKMNNNPVYETTQVPDVAGILGAFRQILIGEWGVLDLAVNKFGTGHRAGNLELRALQTIGVVIRHPEAFTKFEAFS